MQVAEVEVALTELEGQADLEAAVPEVLPLLA
jgi:hypothetical protein